MERKEGNIAWRKRDGKIIEKFLKKINAPGTAIYGAMHNIGEFLSNVTKLNEDKRNFRLLEVSNTFILLVNSGYKEYSKSFN